MPACDAGPAARRTRAAYGDVAAVGQGHRAACRFDGGYKGAFGGQIRFDQGCDIVHGLTICSGGPDSQRDREIAGRELFPESDQLI